MSGTLTDSGETGLAHEAQATNHATLSLYMYMYRMGMCNLPLPKKINKIKLNKKQRNYKWTSRQTNKLLRTKNLNKKSKQTNNKHYRWDKLNIKNRNFILSLTILQL